MCAAAPLWATMICMVVPGPSDSSPRDEKRAAASDGLEFSTQLHGELCRLAARELHDAERHVTYDGPSTSRDSTTRNGGGLSTSWADGSLQHALRTVDHEQEDEKRDYQESGSQPEYFDDLDSAKYKSLLYRLTSSANILGTLPSKGGEEPKRSKS